MSDNMKFGVCRGLDDFEAFSSAVAAGADYLETGFGCLAEFSDDKFDECKEILQKCYKMQIVQTFSGTAGNL